MSCQISDFCSLTRWVGEQAWLPAHGWAIGIIFSYLFGWFLPVPNIKVLAARHTQVLTYVLKGEPSADLSFSLFAVLPWTVSWAINSRHFGLSKIWAPIFSPVICLVKPSFYFFAYNDRKIEIVRERNQLIYSLYLKDDSFCVQYLVTWKLLSHIFLSIFL